MLYELFVYRLLLSIVRVPTQRASYALLYINKVFVGIYYMHEDIDSTFIKSRIEGDYGNLIEILYLYITY